VLQRSRHLARSEPAELLVLRLLLRVRYRIQTGPTSESTGRLSKKRAPTPRWWRVMKFNGFVGLLSAICFVVQVIIGGQFNEWLAAANLISATINGGIYLVWCGMLRREH
jgi:hypothetical protein